MSFKCACDVDAETRLSGRRLPVGKKGLLGPKKRLAEFVLELRFFFVDLPKPHPVRGLAAAASVSSIILRFESFDRFSTPIFPTVSFFHELLLGRCCRAGVPCRLLAQGHIQATPGPSPTKSRVDHQDGG